MLPTIPTPSPRQNVRSSFKRKKHWRLLICIFLRVPTVLPVGLLSVFGKLLWAAEPVSYLGFPDAASCHHRTPLILIPEKKSFNNFCHGLLQHSRSKPSKTYHFDPGKIRRGSETVSANLRRLWCAKYQQSTLRFFVWEAELTGPLPHDSAMPCPRLHSMMLGVTQSLVQDKHTQNQVLWHTSICGLSEVPLRWEHKKLQDLSE